MATLGLRFGHNLPNLFNDWWWCLGPVMGDFVTRISKGRFGIAALDFHTVAFVMFKVSAGRFAGITVNVHEDISSQAETVGVLAPGRNDVGSHGMVPCVSCFLDACSYTPGLGLCARL